MTDDRDVDLYRFRLMRPGGAHLINGSPEEVVYCELVSAYGAVASNDKPPVQVDLGVADTTTGESSYLELTFEDAIEIGVRLVQMGELGMTMTEEDES